MVVADVDRHHAKAVATGADVVPTPQDQDYDDRGYVAQDSEGNRWSFGTYLPGGHKGR